MQHSGYIKFFVLEDTGYKFYTAEDLTFGEFLFKNVNYNPLPIFTLVLIKNNFIKDKHDIEAAKIVELGTLNIHINVSSGGGRLFGTTISGYSFTSNIADGVIKYKINAKDILNIRSEISTVEELGKFTHFFPKRDYELDNNNQFYTYLAT